MNRKVYVASSWRNPIQQSIVALLRDAGHEVYDFRNPAPDNKGFASWSEVNPDWIHWTPEQFVKDLYAGHPAVTRGYGFDKAALDWCDTCVLVLPCGRSAHLEAGYAAGRGKLTLFYLHPDKFEPELMYLLGQGCVTTGDELLEKLAHPPEVSSSDQQRIASWFAANGGKPSLLNSIRRTEKEFDELKAAVESGDAGSVREEFADVGICLMLAAHEAGFDLLDAMRWKHTINEQRHWRVDELGCLSHIKGTDPRDVPTADSDVSNHTKIRFQDQWNERPRMCQIHNKIRIPRKSE
jgi:NTP pyrophosphatase (non-canonical NTP hydrolase)